MFLVAVATRSGKVGKEAHSFRFPCKSMCPTSNKNNCEKKFGWCKILCLTGLGRGAWTICPKSYTPHYLNTTLSFVGCLCYTDQNLIMVFVCKAIFGRVRQLSRANDCSVGERLTCSKGGVLTLCASEAALMDIASKVDGANEKSSILHVARVMSGTFGDFSESVLQGVLVRKDFLSCFFPYSKIN